MYTSRYPEPVNTTQVDIPTTGKKDENILQKNCLVVAHARRHAAHSTHTAHATRGHTAFGCMAL